MSYCRFGWDGSDVYVYDDTSGGTTCCACLLSHSRINLATHADMIAHLERHREAGHEVPQYAIDDLRESQDNEADGAAKP